MDHRQTYTVSIVITEKHIHDTREMTFKEVRVKYAPGFVIVIDKKGNQTAIPSATITGISLSPTEEKLTESDVARDTGDQSSQPDADEKKGGEGT
jgi:hypothetical protein